MKILQLINNLNGGGAEKLVYDLVKLLNNKTQIEVALLNNKGDRYSKKLIDQGINVTILGKKKYSVKTILSLIRLIRKNNFDVVHVHLFPSLYYGALLSIFFNCRFIFTEHSTSNKRRNLFLFRLLDAIAYGQYNSITCISQATKSNLIKFLYWVDESKIKIISNGIFLPSNAIPIVLNKTKKTIKLIMIGRFEYPKDQETIIKALKHLPSRIEIFFAGSGIREKDCKKLSITEGLDQRIHFLGFVEDVNSLLIKMDIAVLSSHYEGFGLAAVESMALGIPTIVSNVPGLVNVVGKGGIVFEPGNEIDLANKIKQLINSQSLYNHISIEGINQAKQYDINTIVENYLNLYKLPKSEEKIDSFR
ncbi:glycosyltransferase family 4 protein [Membranihabitans maritimus]|uniref:glycosyltransferase family 4 protein n=1 Tax=Membranihabitans maritimus TaxID=2904244 RepID=UPI001F20CDC5|nr:glycosyltransferase family 4 protein [Membranihabitans maritimus]